MIKKLVLVMMIIFCSIVQPSLAVPSPEEQDVMLVSDMHETIGKDLMSLIDTKTLDIKGDIFYEVFPSPNADKILVKVFVPAYPKSKSSLGGIYALYMANPDGCDFERITHSLTPTNNRGIEIVSPEWSASGKYFSYLELIQNERKCKISSKLCILDKNRELIQKIDLSLENPYYCGVWFLSNDKRGISQNDRYIIYDLNNRTRSELKISGNACLSPDNKKISFTEVYNDMHVLNIMYIESGKIESIFSSPSYAIADTKWSPDSNKIMFTERIERIGDSAIYEYSQLVLDINDRSTYSFTVSTYDLCFALWYPDSERLILKEFLDDSVLVSSYKILSDEKHELFNDTESPESVFITPLQDIILITKATHMMIPPYRWHSLVFINDHGQYAIQKVFDWKWKGNDFVYRSDKGLFFLNTTDYKIHHLELPLATSNTFNIDSQGRYLYANNSIFEINKHAGQEVSLDTIDESYIFIEQKDREIEKTQDQTKKNPDIGRINPDKFRMEENINNATNSDVKASGFTLLSSICSFLFAFCIILRINTKKEK